MTIVINDKSAANAMKDWSDRITNVLDDARIEDMEEILNELDHIAGEMQDCRDFYYRNVHWGEEIDRKVHEVRLDESGQGITEEPVGPDDIVIVTEPGGSEQMKRATTCSVCGEKLITDCDQGGTWMECPNGCDHEPYVGGD